MLNDYEILKLLPLTLASSYDQFVCASVCVPVHLSQWLCCALGRGGGANEQCGNHWHVCRKDTGKIRFYA